MTKTSWTIEQLAAIEQRGSLLVAAAAGSGKTAVLVERIVRRLTDLNDPVGVDRLLVVTFTKAAANEMKERIRIALDQALSRETDPGVSGHLLHQLVLIPQANITTLHAFCLELLREYFYHLDLDPAFRVADEVEAELLRQDTLDELFEEKYEQEDSSFFRLVEAFGSDRDDSPLGQHVLRLYEMAYSQPDPGLWLRELADAYVWDDAEDLAASPWGLSVRQGIGDQVQVGVNAMARALAKAQEHGGPQHYLPLLQEEHDQIQRLLQVISEGSWSDVERELQSLKFRSLPSKRLNKENLGEFIEAQIEAKKKEVQELRNYAKRRLSTVKNDVQWELADQLSHLREMGVLVQDLAQLAGEFAELYRRNKRRRNIVDFSDFEHLALNLLEKDDPAASITSDLQSRFVEVLVDEYQDINAVQERILQQVSRQENGLGNLFMVGDVKQSIYRFRLADPTLFLAKYSEFHKWKHNQDAINQDQTSVPIAIDLARNFRSRQEVIDGVNFLFYQIMTEGAGEIAYDDRAALQYGANFVSGQAGLITGEGPIEVHLFDKSLGSQDLPDKGDDQSIEIDNVIEGEQGTRAEESGDLEELELGRVEARLVASRIKHMVRGNGSGGEFQLYDSALAGFRPVQYSDIVILMRSYSTQAWLYQEEFQRAGIPVYAETSKGYFAANEVEIILSLLEVIDNPRQDIPLAGVLRSPIVGLNGAELGKLRTVLPSGDFYEACTLLVWSLIKQKKGAVDIEEAEIQEVLKGYQASWELMLQAAHSVCASAPELAPKLLVFWANLQKWRDFSRRNSLADLIWLIYRDTGYYAYVGLLPGGVQRQANLRVLHDRACRFEITHYRGLFRFLRFLKRFRSQGKDMGNARTLGERENVVRLQTVHSSKGLEFPVVFVVGLGTAFNTRSLSEQMLLHPDLGIGLPICDVKNRTRYPSFVRYALKQRLAKESLAEELRILYVALTRAKERLLLFGGVPNLDKSLAKWSVNDSWPYLTLPEEELRGAKCYLDWICPALYRHPDGLFGEESRSSLSHLPAANSRWQVILHDNSGKESVQTEEIQAVGYEIGTKVQNGLETTEQIEQGFAYWYDQIDQRWSWVYPYQDLVLHRAKTSVSELKRAGGANSTEDISQKVSLWKRPKFIQQRITAAERGSAWHVLMQHLPFPEWKAIWSTCLLDAQLQLVMGLLDSLIARQILGEEQKSGIVPKQIVNLLNSDLGRRLWHAETVYREYPFTLTFCRTGTQEEILVQGVVDALIIGEGGTEAELVDYKTDYIPADIADPAAFLQTKYALQLAIYASAVERLLKLSVKRCTVYSFALDQSIEVSREVLTRAIGDLQELELGAFDKNKGF